MKPRWIVVSGIMGPGGEQHSLQFVYWSPWKWLARYLATCEQQRLAKWAERPRNMFTGVMTTEEWVDYQEYRTSLLTSGNSDLVFDESETTSTP